MKWILSLSLVANVILGFFLITNHKNVPYEQLVIETHMAPQKDEVTTSLAVPTRKQLQRATKIDKQEDLENLADSAHDYEMTQTHEQLESERSDFFTRELGLSQEEIFEYQRLRNEYFNKTSDLWKENPFGEVSFESRRKALAMEEKLHADLSRHFGKKKWDRYQKYREEFNKRGFEKQLEENQPFLFMGL